jgi:hypothetical protein
MNLTCEVAVSLTDFTSTEVISLDDYQIISTFPDQDSSNLAKHSNLDPQLIELGSLKQPISIISDDKTIICMVFQDARAVLLLRAEAEHKISDDQLEFLQALYHQTNIAITKIGQMNQAGQFAKVVEQAVNAVSAKRGALHRYDSESRRLVFVASYNRGPGPLVNISDGLSGYLVRTKTPHIIENNYNSSLWAHPIHKGNRPFPSVLKMLLQWNNEIVGVLSL